MPRMLCSHMSMLGTRSQHRYTISVTRGKCSIAGHLRCHRASPSLLKMTEGALVNASLLFPRPIGKNCDESCRGRYDRAHRVVRECQTASEVSKIDERAVLERTGDLFTAARRTSETASCGRNAWKPCVRCNISDHVACGKEEGRVACVCRDTAFVITPQTIRSRHQSWHCLAVNPATTRPW